jgi:drug/metabolite transporter (DMT)-like permease
MFLGVVFSILAAISWGLVYVLDQKILLNFSVIKLLFYTSAIYIVLMLPVVLLSRKSETHISSADYPVLQTPYFWILIGFTLLAEVFILKSVQGVGATTASLFEISYPLFTALFAFYILRQPLHWATLLGGLFMILGAGIILYTR